MFTNKKTLSPKGTLLSLPTFALILSGSSLTVSGCDDANDDAAMETGEESGDTGDDMEDATSSSADQSNDDDDGNDDDQDSDDDSTDSGDDDDSETSDSGDEGTQELPSIVDIAVGDDRFSTLVAALKAADLVDTLAGDGPFTVLAPTNDAFDSLPEGVLDDLLEDKEALTQLLLHHVVSGEVVAEDIVEIPYTESLAEQTLLINASDGVKINDATVIEADVMAQNGVIHAIDTVLMLPAGTIVDIAASNDDFSTLVTAVQTAELVDALSGDDDLTVFAPPNSAFEDLPEGLLDALLADKDALTEVLLYHVAAGATYAADLEDGMSIPTLLEDQSLEVDLSSGVRIGESTPTTTDILATNGVIHVIDAVLVPPNVVDNLTSVGDLTSEDPQLSTLHTAIEAAGLGDELAAPGGFTVFAPTNAAFAALPKDVLSDLLANPSKLRNVLLHHVVDSRVTSDQLPDIFYAKSRAGQTLLFDTSRGVTVSGSNVITADIKLWNGVVHVVDTVILPPMDTVVGVAAGNPDFSTLVTAVQAAGLVDALSGDGPFTVFAPTNAAFDALPAGTLDTLLADPDALADILLYHVAGAELYSADLSDGADLNTLLAGQSVEVDLSSGVMINDSNVVAADVLATNGVIHVIDSVLLP